MDENNTQTSPVEQQPSTQVASQSFQATTTTAKTTAPGSSAAALPLARNWYRFWASVTDSMLIGASYIAFFVILSFISKSMTNSLLESKNILLGLIFLLPLFIYRIYFTVAKGATIGKDTYGLKVVKENTTDNISYKQGVIRELINNAAFIIPLLGILDFINRLTILFTKRGIHDRIARTHVVQFGTSWPIKKQLPFFIGLLALVIIEYFILISINPEFISKIM